MKIKHLILLTTATVAVSSLTSCNDEPYVITAEEEYTHNFIKAFGLIDPKQDWNLAQSSAVTVKVGDKAAEVKAYMKADNTYYLVANLNGVSGDVKIPFDMPEGTKDIMVKINGKRYYTSPGGTIDPNNPTRSRAALGGIGKGGLGTSGTYAGVEVTIEKNINDDGSGYLTLTEETMKEVINNKLPEETEGNRNWDQTNLDVDNVYGNFYAYAKEFYLFPEYWNTNSTSTNIIGVYWEVDAETTGAEAVEGRDENGNTKTYYIVRVPFFNNPINFFNFMVKDKVAFDSYIGLDNWEMTLFPALLENYPDSYKKENGKYYHKYTTSEHNNEWLEFSATYIYDYQGEHPDYGAEVGNDLCTLFPDVFVIDNSICKKWGLAEESVNWGVQSPNYKDSYKDAVSYRSYAVHVKFDRKMRFGFYLEQGTRVMYSETKLNPLYTALTTVGGESETRAVSYVATYKEGEDTDGNPKRHLCFEDWAGTVNFDLNDMVFRIYGLDAMNSTNPNKPIETGDVVDHDKTTPTNPGNEGGGKDDPTPEVDKPYDWLLAVEDLGATDDFDFNDIIVGITAEYVVNPDLTGARTLGKAVANATQGDVTGDLWTEVKFTALAAGGTLPAYVYFGDTLLYPDGHSDRSEWHKWFGNGTIGSGTMINTNHGVDNQEGATCTLYFGVDDSGDYLFTVEKLGMNGKNNSTDAKNSGFKIGIDKADATSDYISHYYFTKGEDGYFVKPSAPGSAPQMFLIPDRWNKDKDNTGLSTYDTGKWQWPTERTHIQASYSRFGDWVKNAESASDWYKDKGSNVCRPTKK